MLGWSMNKIVSLVCLYSVADLERKSWAGQLKECTYFFYWQTKDLRKIKNLEKDKKSTRAGLAKTVDPSNWLTKLLVPS
jgi:hypothetical protein